MTSIDSILIAYVCLFNIASQKEMLAITHEAAAQIESADAVCSVLERYVKDQQINQNFAEVIHCPAHISQFH